MLNKTATTSGSLQHTGGNNTTKSLFLHKLSPRLWKRGKENQTCSTAVMTKLNLKWKKAG